MTLAEAIYTAREQRLARQAEARATRKSALKTVVVEHPFAVVVGGAALAFMGVHFLAGAIRGYVPKYGSDGHQPSVSEVPAPVPLPPGSRLVDSTGAPYTPGPLTGLNQVIDGLFGITPPHYVDSNGNPVQTPAGTPYGVQGGGLLGGIGDILAKPITAVLGVPMTLAGDAGVALGDAATRLRIRHGNYRAGLALQSLNGFSVGPVF